VAIDPDTLTPVQRKVLDGLLAPGPRPVADLGVAPRLRAFLEERTEPALSHIPAGDRGLYVNKTALDALHCDGRYLDRLDTTFSWTPAMVKGTLAHEGIAVDVAGGGSGDPAAVMDYAWGEFASSGRPAGDFLAGLGPVEAEALRGQATQILTEFRETFPPLDPAWHPRVEPELRVGLHERRVVLVGRPDLLIGRATRDRRRMLLIDLKTGQRHHQQDRADMRFYALLATLKYGVAPFRVATFYLAEGEWDHEDVDDEVLDAAARSVVEKVNRAAVLTYDRPDDGLLRLNAGPACRWCGRQPDCPAWLALEAE
jgi:hypothetical protein